MRQSVDDGIGEAGFSGETKEAEEDGGRTSGIQGSESRIERPERGMPWRWRRRRRRRWRRRKRKKGSEGAVEEQIGAETEELGLHRHDRLRTTSASSLPSFADGPKSTVKESQWQLTRSTVNALTGSTL
jgi:hypothetical protein